MEALQAISIVTSRYLMAWFRVKHPNKFPSDQFYHNNSIIKSTLTGSMVYTTTELMLLYFAYRYLSLPKACILMAAIVSPLLTGYKVYQINN